jgi:hypothetical protein
MAKLTLKERFALEHLQEFAQKAMRSKPVLRTMSALQDKGMIEFDPFAGEAKLTAAGEQHLNNTSKS